MMAKRLDLLDECWEAATICLAEYQQSLPWCYNRDVKTREFSAGDLVLRRAIGNMRDMNLGKLAPYLGRGLIGLLLSRVQGRIT